LQSVASLQVFPCRCSAGNRPCTHTSQKLLCRD
jgi:hypothetical protein